MLVRQKDKDSLLKAAAEAAHSAYCPFSSFRVGAAALAGDDLFTGCNIENASFGLTTCAERVAIFKAISSGERKIRAIAVSCPDAVTPDIASKMPCGACLQVLSEFADDDCVLLLDGAGEFLLKELLPHRFKLR